MTSASCLPSRLSRQLLTWRPLFQNRVSPLRAFSQASFPLLDSTKEFEEETLPWYSPDDVYPVKIGEVLQSRYRVVGKLGYGAYSTVWLCRDQQQHTYVTLKVFERNSSEGPREIEAYRHLNSLSVANHAGVKLIRKTLDSFHIPSAEGTFPCLVHPPMGMNIKEQDIMMAIEDASIPADFEEEEKSNPSPQKIDGDRVTYTSRKLRKTRQHGRPTLCDLGQARFGSNTYAGDIQPYIYRAPEVLLQMPWNEKVDIWNVGVLTWTMSQTRHLFYAQDSEKKPSDAHHLAEMIAIMGPPPQELIQNSAYATDFFDGEGNWKGNVDIPPISLEKLEGFLQGEPQQLFLQFMRKMPKWKPEERESARDLLDDPWLQSF